MSQLVTIENLIEGQVIFEPVVNSYGQTLIPAGIILTTKHIQLLKTWNIRSLYVKGDETEQVEEISVDAKNQAKDYVVKKCKWQPRNNNERDLFKMAIQHYERIFMRK